MEQKLENIEDYNTLRGQKKRIVWTVIVVGLLLGALFTYLDKTVAVDDALVEQKENVIIMHKNYSNLPPKY